MRAGRWSEPLFGIDPGAVREVGVGELAIRFVFGAGVSMVAGVVSLVWGARVGGVLLAFPAILPATLTLIEQQESKEQAEQDDEGAVIGAAALGAFAGTAWWLLDGHSALVALTAATLAWLIVAVGLYVIIRLAASKRAAS
jgi:uncharacterized membrane protein (GlpM family)